MSRRWLILGILIVVFVGALAGKLAFDVYQMDRARAELPTVIALLDSIDLPGGTSRVPSDAESSVNEYAASIWRYYKTDISRDEFRAQFEAQVRGLGFRDAGESQTYGGRLHTYQRGEYEFRLLIFSASREEGDLALSANWYGADR